MSSKVESFLAENFPHDSYRSSILKSTILHVVVILAFSVRPLFFSQETIELKNAIQVDLVGMPEKVQPPVEVSEPAPPKLETPKKTAETKAETKPEPPKPKVNLKDNSKKLQSEQLNALAKLKQMEALEKIKKDMAKEDAAQEAAETAKTAVLKKGNVISPGTSLSGLSKVEFDRYILELRNRVYSLWELPQFLSGAELKTQLLALVDERGYVVQKRVLVSSGNEIFDNTALAALERASPFSPPPERLQAILRNDGVTFNFP